MHIIGSSCVFLHIWHHQLALRGISLYHSTLARLVHINLYHRSLEYTKFNFRSTNIHYSRLHMKLTAGHTCTFNLINSYGATGNDSGFSQKYRKPQKGFGFKKWAQAYSFKIRSESKYLIWMKHVLDKWIVEKWKGLILWHHYVMIDVIKST